MNYIDAGMSEDLGFHDILVDLLSSLSTVKALSEIDNHQKTNEKELILNALNILITNQDMERCSFFVKTEQDLLVNLTGLSSSEATNGIHENHQSLTFKIGEGVIGAAAKTGILQNCTDCQYDTRFSLVQDDITKRPGSIISVPIMALSELYGVLNISHPEAHYFSDWHVRLMEIYKNILGQLISNYRLFQQMEQQIELKTAHLQKALDEAHLLKQRFEKLSMIDTLTGLYNRRYFYAQATQNIAVVQRYGNSLCLLLLDLDFFKSVNDNYGHHAGDQVLESVAEVLKAEMRSSDMVARWGGEEFVVLFANVDCANGRMFSERIRCSIAALQWIFDCQRVSITVSIGMYCINQKVLQDKGEDIDTFIHCADLAMYRAKLNGRNQVVAFREEFLDK